MLRQGWRLARKWSRANRLRWRRRRRRMSRGTSNSSRMERLRRWSTCQRAWWDWNRSARTNCKALGVPGARPARYSTRPPNATSLSSSAAWHTCIAASVTLATERLVLHFFSQPKSTTPNNPLPMSCNRVLRPSRSTFIRRNGQAINIFFRPTRPLDNSLNKTFVLFPILMTSWKESNSL